MFVQGREILSKAALILALSLALQGCIFGGGRSASGLVREELIHFEGKVKVDAYLFDVKLKQNGKQRSVRLDIYFADTLALFTARAYLGKGVAKGIWQEDSSLFYFPTENEFYAGPLDELVRAGCASGGELQRVVPALLSGNLMKFIGDSAVHISEDTGGNSKNIEATVRLGSCETLVTLLFDAHTDSMDQRLYYLKEFSYDPQDGKSKVVGKRRVLKRGKGLSASKFSLNIPIDASPVQW